MSSPAPRAFQHRQIAQHHEAVTESLLGPDQKSQPAQVLAAPTAIVIQQLPNRRRDAEILEQYVESAFIQFEPLCVIAVQHPEHRQVVPRACRFRLQSERRPEARLGFGPAMTRIENVAQRDLRRRIVVANRQRLPATGLRFVQRRCSKQDARKGIQRIRVVRPERQRRRAKDSASSSRSSRRRRIAQVAHRIEPRRVDL